MKVNDAITLALQNVKKEGLTDVEVFTRPFELSMIKDKVEGLIINAIKASFKQNNIKSLKVSPIGHVLVPKKELFDFRKCAHIHPLDELKYLSLVLQLANAIEQMRINRSRNIIFSYRFGPQKGYLFDPRYNFTSFRSQISKKSKSNRVNVVVSCDISNFYDRLNIHRLECILASSPKAALIEVDNYLLSKKIDFCRFVDDYRIFAKDSATAHHWLSLLVDKLSKEGLFLNTSKTEIKDVSKDKKTEDDAEIEKTDTIASEEVSQLDEETLRNKLNIPVIIRGYSGLIPTKFRALTESEKKKLLELELPQLFKDLNESIVMKPKVFVTFAKTCVAQESSEMLVRLIGILNKFPQFIPYSLDIILKHEHLFSSKQIEKISTLLNTWLSEGNASEYILIYIVRFFGSGRFSNKTVLFEYFRSLKRNEGSYIGRAVLEQLEPLVARGEVLEIRDYYSRADHWEKRQIAKMVDIHFTQGEKRPFFKNILSLEEDIFLNNTLDFYNKKT